MLSFEQKKNVFHSFQLTEKMISRGRVNFIFPESKQSSNILARELHPSGNGYVIGKYMSVETIKNNGYNVDSRGWISIKNFSDEELINVISEAMKSMSGQYPVPIKNMEKEVKEEQIFYEDSSIFSLENLIRSCLYNWLGYGNLNGRIWIIGMEEGGAEIWRCKTKTMEESLKLRSTFEIAMDFKNVWEDLYKIPLETFKGPNVWRYAAAFILEFEGKESTPEKINEFIFVTKQLGRKNGKHFLCEYMPLPKQSRNSIEPYHNVWKTTKEYYEEVEQKRFQLIKETMARSDVQVIVSYNRYLTAKLIKFLGLNFHNTDIWEFGNKKYSLYRIILNPEKKIYLLATPFFGNGRVSYDGLRYAATKVKHIVEVMIPS